MYTPQTTIFIVSFESGILIQWIACDIQHNIFSTGPKFTCSVEERGRPQYTISRSSNPDSKVVSLKLHMQLQGTILCVWVWEGSGDDILGRRSRQHTTSLLHLRTFAIWLQPSELQELKLMSFRYRTWEVSWRWQFGKRLYVAMSISACGQTHRTLTYNCCHSSVSRHWCSHCHDRYTSLKKHDSNEKPIANVNTVPRCKRLNLTYCGNTRSTMLELESRKIYGGRKRYFDVQ